MFIDREDPIQPEQWRHAVESTGARLTPGALEVELLDDEGVWRSVLRWNGSGADFSMMRFHEPFLSQLRAIVAALNAYIVDNDGARY